MHTGNKRPLISTLSTENLRFFFSSRSTKIKRTLDFPFIQIFSVKPLRYAEINFSRVNKGQITFGNKLLQIKSDM